jgi:hypothetical protein
MGVGRAARLFGSDGGFDWREGAVPASGDVAVFLALVFCSRPAAMSTRGPSVTLAVPTVA